LVTNLALFAPLFSSDACAVLHAGRQDLEIFELTTGVVPHNVIDTQIAGGFLGYSAPSLATLLEKELGVKAPKADRLTDWLRRPLSDRQLLYAAADVSSLVALANRLREQLEELGRLGWLTEAVAETLTESRGARPPEDAWRRIKEARHLRGADLATAQGIAEWREKRAQRLDLTPRYVLADLAVVGLAVARPTTLAGFDGIRGVDGRALRNVAPELIAVIAESSQQPPRRDVSAAVNELPSVMRPALPLVSAWVSQLSREMRIEPSLLATRSDLEAFLRGDESARLRTGWRAELVGTPLQRLIDGDASLAFERGGGLVLEDRARRSASEPN
jgi:ribonuclease D